MFQIWMKFNGFFNRYKITLIKPSLKALTLSSKISVRMDNRGFLSLQFMIQNEDNQISFVEYLVSNCCYNIIVISILLVAIVVANQAKLRLILLHGYFRYLIKLKCNDNHYLNRI